VTGARIGELLAVRWDDVSQDEVTFLETKNGCMRALPIGASLR
jgi:integrase